MSWDQYHILLPLTSFKITFLDSCDTKHHVPVNTPLHTVVIFCALWVTALLLHRPCRHTFVLCQWLSLFLIADLFTCMIWVYFVHLSFQHTEIQIKPIISISRHVLHYLFSSPEYAQFCFFSGTYIYKSSNLLLPWCRFLYCNLCSLSTEFSGHSKRGLYFCCKIPAFTFFGGKPYWNWQIIFTENKIKWERNENSLKCSKVYSCLYLPTTPTDQTFCTIWMTAIQTTLFVLYGWQLVCYANWTVSQLDDCSTVIEIALFLCALSSWGKLADCHTDQTFCALWRIVHSRVDCRHVYGTCVHGMWQTSLIYFNIYPALWLKVLYSYKERLVRTTVHKRNFKQ